MSSIVRYSLLALLCGCLDTPPPASIDGGVAMDASTVIDGGGADAFEAPPMDFPPAGWTLDIIGGDVLDIDGDGIDDMLLFNRDAANADRQGVFILLGRHGVSIGASYHAHIPTDVIPRTVFAYPLSPDDTINDVLVMGEDTDDSNAYLEAFEGSEQLTFEVIPRKRLNPTMPFNPASQREGWWISSGQFYGSGLDLLLGSGNYFAIMTFEWWGVDFQNNVDTVVPLAGGGLPAEVRMAYSIETANQGYDDLVLVQIGGIKWWNNDGAGTFDMENDVLYQASDCGETWMFVHDRAQFDGVGEPDVIGQCGDDVGARVLSTDEQTHVFTGGFNLTNETIWIDLEQVFRPNDADTRPDIVLMRGRDVCVSPAPVSLQLMSDLRIEWDDTDQRDELRGDVPPAIDLADGCPKAMLIADFDDDGMDEVWVVHEDGVGECFDISQSGLIACAD